jgi:hypothetical protein
MRRGVLTPSKLASVTGFTLAQIKHDLIHFRTKSQVWLNEQAKGGYIFQAQNASDQLQDMIEELQQKRTEPRVKNDTELLIKVDSAIANFIAMRFQLAMSGPGLASMQSAMNRVGDEMDSAFGR